MIIARAPLRISFVGGGTDLADFYTRYPGRVISTSIDKFVHVVLNRTPLIPKIAVRYGTTAEQVDHADQIIHSRARAAFLDRNITKGIEMGSFSSLPSKTGLGSSSAFSVALMKALSAYEGKKTDKREIAEAASRLEIELLNEPIGKQDQYAAAFGGFNIFQFNPDHTVDVCPVLLDYRIKLGLEDRILLFFTGIPRDASSVLTEQKSNIDKKFETLKKMSDSVLNFEQLLLAADYQGLGKMLHEGWLLKKTLASNVTTSSIDKLYSAGMDSGAWGGKVLGAGGGGCVMFIASPEKHAAIRASLFVVALSINLVDFQEIPVRFVESGAEVLHNSDHNIYLS